MLSTFVYDDSRNHETRFESRPSTSLIITTDDESAVEDSLSSFHYFVEAVYVSEALHCGL